MSNVKAFLPPGGTDRLVNALQHLREILDDDEDGQAVGLLLFWKTVDPETGQARFFHSIFGDLTESDLAYMSVILAAKAVARPEVTST